MINLKRFTLALRLTKGLGYKTYLQMIELSHGLENLYHFKFSKKYERLQSLLNQAKNIYDVGADRDLPLQDRNISYVCIWEDTYPSLLKQIPDAPLVLFYKGNLHLSALEKSVSIVGTRKLTQYGKQVTEDVTRHLTLSGYSIISGLAFGVDALAHQTALDNDTYTVAVLASSPDHCTPRGNLHIYNKILESGGAIVSEHFPGEEVRAGQFTTRNRIIAGLSRYTIVTEAGEKSGALITADCAFHYDREVFAIPNGIYAGQSRGCNQLIYQQKAQIYYELRTLNDEQRTINDRPPTANDELLTINPEQRIALLPDSYPRFHVMIHNMLQSMPLTIEELVLQTTFEYDMVVEVCSELELEGHITRQVDGKYIIKS